MTREHYAIVRLLAEHARPASEIAPTTTRTTSLNGPKRAAERWRRWCDPSQAIRDPRLF